MPKTTVTESTYTDRNGDERTQYRTTVPKDTVELLGLEDADLVWDAKSRNTIELRVIRDGE